MGSTEAPTMLDEIQQRLIHLEKSFTAEKENNNILKKKIEDIQNNYFNVAMSNDSIKHKLKNITEENTHLLDYAYDIQCRLLKAEQYLRRGSIEIMGIPDNIAHKDLEQS